MNNRAIRYTGFLLAVTALLAAWATGASRSSDLAGTLDRLFNKRDFDTERFGPARWTDGGRSYTTLEPSASFPKTNDEGSPRDIVLYDTASGHRQVAVSASALVPSPGSNPLLIEDYAWSQDNQTLLVYTNSRKVWRRNTRGDYWILQLSTGKLKKLGGDRPESSLMFAKLSPNGRTAAWVYDNNLYLEDFGSGAIRPLTTDGSATRVNGTSDWVNEEEFDIRDGFRWSPDGKYIAYWQFDTTGVGQFTLINDTIEQYPVLKQFLYPLAGTTNSAVRVGVISADGGPTEWIDVPGDIRNHYIPRIAWAPNSQELLLEHLNRLQNTNEALLADARTGAVRKIFEDTDSAWVDIVDSLEWIGNADAFVWLSERNGWRQAYSVSKQTGQTRLVTTPPADVIEEVAVDPAGRWLYYIASPDRATGRYLYRARLDSQGAPERLTPDTQPGTHGYDVSPDGAWAFHTYSRFDQPPVTDLIRLPEHRSVRTLETNEKLARNTQELLPSPTEFFEVQVAGGVQLDGWMIKPRDFDPAKKYPVLVYVYGEPAAVTVTDAWDGKRFLFHRAIANEGYLVVSFDNQGTPAPKGRAWRKSVYGAVGVLSSQQQTAAIRQFAKERPYVDASRLAVWGWSGGGSNTLNLMFRSPGLFATGMAVAPVADQRYYDTIYQERYMGLPEQNVRGYHDGSPINFATGLAGKLLIVHGSGDDNCHYQGTELLLNRLIELGKPFDFMDYPNRTHAISEGPGTSLHLHRLLARYLEEHIPPGGVPR
jgi:dipeptidyl-peptidase 4